MEEAKKCQLLCSSCHLKKTKAAKDGYDKRAKGIRVANSKLTEDQIAKIRNSQATNAELAVIYGVRRNTIRQIRLGLTWKHLPL